MTITTRTVDQVTCNRCRHEDMWTSDTPDYLKFEWGRFEQVYTGAASFDLCPVCTREVKAWIRNGK